MMIPQNTLPSDGIRLKRGATVRVLQTRRVHSSILQTYGDNYVDTYQHDRLEAHTFMYIFSSGSSVSSSPRSVTRFLFQFVIDAELRTLSTLAM